MPGVNRQTIDKIGMLFALLGFALAGSAHADASSPAASPGDFIADARLLSRLVACAGDAELPTAWPSAELKHHCTLLHDLVSKYRTRWIDRTQPFLAKVVPTDLPKAVVYPFGGGDLVTALATFPNADEFTTISLEAAGDVRGVGSIAGKDLAPSLDSTFAHLRSLFAVSHSKTTNLRAGSHSSLPGEIAFALVAFSVFDYEPVSLHYVRLDAQGKVTYLQPDDLVAVKDGPNPFANVEIAFRSRLDDKAPVRVYRHFAANLDNSHFQANRPLALHLAAQGDVAALIKAASYLLWFDSFSHIRAYLLDHATWMLSDSTGIPPSLARAAGFEQECFGLFHGPMLAQYSNTKSEFLALWEASPRRPLPFYFGYPDIDGHGHMMVTRRAGKSVVADAPAGPALDQVSGGSHWRLLTPKGPVHVWQPRGYDPATAGTVIYVHGYYTNVDGAWVQHALAEQFAASKVNALFIVPEAPSGSSEEVFWPVLGDLLAEVERQLVGTKAHGPIVVAGHSGAWRTLGGWTEGRGDKGNRGDRGDRGDRDDKDAASVEAFVLLDALYGMDDKFQSWLEQHAGANQPCMTLVSKDTASRVPPFLEKISGAKRRATLPESYKDLTVTERSVPVLEITSDLGHMEIVTSGKVLPVLLHRSPLRTLKAASIAKPARADGHGL